MWRTAKRRKWTCVGEPTVETGSCSSTIYCLAPASTGYCLSTVDFLQPPLATVHPQGPVQPASTAPSPIGYCLTSPLHGVLCNHPSTGYCSSSPPPATVQPALHGVLFIQPSTGSCSSTPNWLDQSGSCSSSGNSMGSCSSNPPTRTVHPNPPTTLTVHQEAAGSIGFS